MIPAKFPRMVPMKSLSLFPLALLALTGCFSADADGDGFVAGVDCDDEDRLTFPGALERCDGIDNDCNDIADDGYSAEAIVYFLDEDGDGYGTTKGSQVSCPNIEPAGYVANAGDCDDSDSEINPEADELCNLVDDNCNRIVDDNPVDAVTYYADNDKDGFGSRTLVQTTCEEPVGWVQESGDCNDFDFLVNPNALEYCDGFDNDCDDEVDEPDAEDHKVFYRDLDLDGYGDANATIDACYLPDGYAVEPTDCNDNPATGGPKQNPGLEEVCKDGLDNDCDGTANQCSWGSWSADNSAVQMKGFGRGYFGYSIDSGGDLDRDGKDDLLVGGYYTNVGGSTSGAAVVLYGDEDSAFEEENQIKGQDLPHWKTSSSYDYFGRHVNGLGDIDGDGYDDLGIGSYTYDPPGTSNAGTMAIIYGRKTRYEGMTNIEIEDTPSLVGPASSTYLGSTFSSAGDQNSDGYPDMLVGGYYYRHDGKFGAGSVFVVPGASSRYSHETKVDSFGKFVGSDSYTYLGYFGPTVDSGDLDADGKPDMAMGAYGFSSYAGASFVVYGTGVLPTGTQVVSEASDATFVGSSSYSYVGGYLTQIPGDINDDGYDDLIVGHYQANGYAGACYINFGGASEMKGGDAAGSADVTIVGQGRSTYLCYGRTALADFNNDGSNELVVGSYRASTGSGTYNGGAYLFQAGSGFGLEEDGVTELDEYQLEDATEVIEGQPGSYGYFGMHLSSGDFNGDGYEDLYAGEYGANGYSGAGHIFLGNSL